MLKSFRVDNFKSLINVAFEPAGLNLLIGPNNAGKTNLCHALRFLSLTARMPLDDAASACTAEPWNLLNVYIQNQRLSLAASSELTLDSESLSFTYELVLLSQKGSRSQLRGHPFVVHRELLKVSGGPFSDTTLLENNDGRVRLLHERRFLRGATPTSPEPQYVETIAPRDATMLYRLYDLETNQRSNLFKRYLGSWGYYALDPSRLRSSQARPMDLALDAAGTNLSSVMFTLHNAQPRAARQIIEAVRLLEPKLDVLSFQAPDPEHVYMFFEDGRGHKFGIDNISDGTLRYLAICYLLLATRETAAETGGCPVISIEEPENGIYVEHLRSLLEKIDASGGVGQFVFTSHSPYFIDLFDTALEGILLVKRGATHSTLIKPDPVKLRDRLGSFSLGELHFRGLFE